MKKSIFSKLAFRYFFEVIVIVFSITASFYIQDLLNKKNQIELKNKALEGVLIELEKDKGFSLDFGKFYNEYRIKTIDSLFENKYPLKVRYLSGIWGNSDLFDNKRFFESLISTGGIDFIRSEKLQGELSSYYNNSYNLIEQAANLDNASFQRFSDQIVNYRLDSINYEWGTYNNRFYFNENDLKKIRNDIRLKSIAMQWKFWLSEYNKRIELAIEKNEILVKLIKEELEN